MAKTGFDTNYALTQKLYQEELYREMKKEIYWDKFMGVGKSAIVQEKTELLKKKGDSIKFGIARPLEGDGVTEGQPLEGNEEKLNTATDAVTLSQKRHAVRDEGSMSRQRVVFDLPSEMREAIKTWGAEKVDQMIFDAAFLSPTKVVYPSASNGVVTLAASAAAAKAALHATNSMINPDFITGLKTVAKTGFDRAIDPLRPYKYQGKEWYILLVHPDSLYDLEVNDEYKAAQQYAMEAGKSNPLFTGAEAAWRGIIVHSHESVPKGNDGGGASVAYSRGILLGQQALCMAWGKRPYIVEKKFEYDEEIGIAFNVICGVKKPVFDSQDYGSIGVYLARTKLSDQ